MNRIKEALDLLQQKKMKVALLMILCLGIVCSGMANRNQRFQAQDATLANVLFQAEGTTNAPKCDVRDRLNYLVSLPNGIQCV